MSRRYSQGKLPTMPPHVAEVFAGYPVQARRTLFDLRSLIFETARLEPQVGPLSETLKWGEPAYLTERTKSGSTIRLGWKRATPSYVYLYFNCHTDLVPSFRARLGEDLMFQGRRAVVLAASESIPRGPLQVCIQAALTYHLPGSRVRRR